MIQKRLSNKDFLPRMPLSLYEESIRDISIFIKSHDDFYKKENEKINTKETYIDKIEILDNTFHELRKLNQELKLQTEHLIFESNNFNWDNIETQLYTLLYQRFCIIRVCSVQQYNNSKSAFPTKCRFLFSI